MEKLNQSGFHATVLIMTVLVIGVIGFAGWKVFGNKNENHKEEGNTQQPQASDEKQEEASVMWMLTENGWVASGTPPNCPNPLNLKTPTPLANATSVLYPGQTRGGNYKPHGGLRFDNTANDKVTVSVPADASVVRGARYIAEGEIQYTFDFIMPCGYMYRLGHLRVLSPTFAAIVDKFPEATEGDSRTTQVQPYVQVKEGDVIATSVGIVSEKNTFYDWGVYDLRKENEASKTATFQQQHASDKELAWHAVCWFDLLSTQDEATVRGLPPGDPTSGKTSDYCK